MWRLRQSTFTHLVGVCCILCLATLVEWGCQAPARKGLGFVICKTDAECPSGYRCAFGICTNIKGTKTEFIQLSPDSGVEPSSEPRPPERPPEPPAPEPPPPDPADCTNGAQQGCYTGPSSTRNITPCQDGVQTCQGGQWGPCQGETTPQQDTCGDQVDNNCDGQIDENCGVCNPGERRPCGPNQGACQPGTETCSEQRQWGTCQGAVGPVQEVCDDQQDNDCDGQIDEGCTPTTGTQCAACSGSCGQHTGKSNACLKYENASQSQCYLGCNGDSDCAKGFKCIATSRTNNQKVCLPQGRIVVGTYYTAWWCDNLPKLRKRCNFNIDCQPRDGIFGRGGFCHNNQCTVYCINDNDCPSGAGRCTVSTPTPDRKACDLK